MKKLSALLCFLFVLTCMCASSSAFTDFRCVNDCTRRGYQYALCMSQCSWDAPPRPGVQDYGLSGSWSRQPEPVPQMNYGDILQKAQELRTQQLQNQMLDLQLRQTQQRQVENDHARADAIARREEDVRLQAEIDRQFQARMAEAARTHPDILRIMNDPTLTISLPMTKAIKESDHPAVIIRFLGEHRDEAEKISKMDPATAEFITHAIGTAAR